VLVSLHGPTAETHYGEAFAQLLANIHTGYGFLASIDQKPFIADPAVPSNDILAKVTVAQWKDFIEKVRVYADIARRAQDAEDMEEATRQWRRVFGDRFRAITNVAKAATFGGFAAAAAAAAGYTRGHHLEQLASQVADRCRSFDWSPDPRPAYADRHEPGASR
jgi:hypothetical protein